MTLLLNTVRGFLIGTAEVIPGISGGTVALVVGIYERILAQVALVARIFVGLRSGPGALKKFRELDWGLLLPVATGMFTAIFIAAATIEPLLESHPEIMRALFAGLIAASIAVPFRMLGKWGLKHYLVGLSAAFFAFGLTSLPRAAAQEPAALVVFLTAMIAVCALVLPGVSGSFFLLTIGMYQPTLAAVNDRDFGYLAIFILGAIAGLLSFAVFMQFLLKRFRAFTLAAMTGLMLGSLRALWPWQDENSQMLPAQDPALPILMFVIGIGAVVALIVVEEKLKARLAQ